MYVDNAILLFAVVTNFRNSTVEIVEVQNIDQSHFSSTVNLPSLDIFNNTVRYALTHVHVIMLYWHMI